MCQLSGWLFKPCNRISTYVKFREKKWYFGNPVYSRGRTSRWYWMDYCIMNNEFCNFIALNCDFISHNHNSISNNVILYLTIVTLFHILILNLTITHFMYYSEVAFNITIAFIPVCQPLVGCFYLLIQSNNPFQPPFLIKVRLVSSLWNNKVVVLTGTIFLSKAKGCLKEVPFVQKCMHMLVLWTNINCAKA